MIDVYIITNEDLDRQELMKNQINNLKLEFRKLAKDVNIFWIRSQDFISLEPISVRLLFKTQIIRMVHDYNFSRYREFSKTLIIHNLMFEIARQIVIWFKPHRIKKIKYFMKIQKIVNYKHDFVLRMIANSHVENALVLEDDAIFCDLNQFVNELTNLSEIHSDKFVNLANVVTIENLCINKLITERRSSELYLKKPITNGLCAYFINRRFASSMLKERLTNNNFDYLPCDFAFNELFLRLYSSKNSSQSPFYSKIYKIPLVEHGSQSLFLDKSVSSILNDEPI
jgi:hypothetical protein